VNAARVSDDLVRTSGPGGKGDGCPWKAAILKGIAEASSLPVLAAIEAGKQSKQMKEKGGDPEKAEQLGSALDGFVKFDEEVFRPGIKENAKELFEAMRKKTNLQAESQPELLETAITVFKYRLEAAGERKDDDMTITYTRLVSIHEAARKRIKDGAFEETEK